MITVIDTLRRFRAFVHIAHQRGNHRPAYALAAFGFSVGFVAASYHYWRGPEFFLAADVFLVALSVYAAILFSLRR